jgi:hypothetical protein
MAAGCPIVTCANGSIPEVAEDAALYVDDSDAGGMLDALTRIQRKEIREPLIQSGIEKCRRFSWSDTAQTIAVFLTDLCRLNSFKSNAGGTLSSHSWRELRNYEWRYAQQKRLREILKRPELKSHVPQAAIAVDGLQELESDWIKAIAQEKDSSKEQ